MESPWRVVQVFLDNKDYRIYEVQTHRGNKTFRCTCGEGGPRDCAHVKFVKRRVDTDGGYRATVLGVISDQEIATAKTSPNAMREFVLRRVKIEVLNGGE